MIKQSERSPFFSFFFFKDIDETLSSMQYSEGRSLTFCHRWNEYHGDYRHFFFVLWHKKEETGFVSEKFQRFKRDLHGFLPVGAVTAASGVP